MSDDDDIEMAPNYDKMRGMGFICWREIPATNDEVYYSNFSKISMIFFVKENGDKQLKKKKKRKIDAIEPEQEIETPIKSEAYLINYSN
jgi:hypothetical protein